MKYKMKLIFDIKPPIIKRVVSSGIKGYAYLEVNKIKSLRVINLRNYYKIINEKNKIINKIKELEKEKFQIGEETEKMKEKALVYFLIIGGLILFINFSPYIAKTIFLGGLCFIGFFSFIIGLKILLYRVYKK